MTDPTYQSPFGSYFEDQKRQRAQRIGTQVAQTAQQGSAAEYGSARLTAQELGLPVGTVLQAPDRFQFEVDQRRSTLALTDSQRMAEWLENPENRALAHDDIANLSRLERFARGALLNVANPFYKGVVGAGLSGVQLGSFALRGTSTILEKQRDYWAARMYYLRHGRNRSWGGPITFSGSVPDGEPGFTALEDGRGRGIYGAYLNARHFGVPTALAMATEGFADDTQRTAFRLHVHKTNVEVGSAPDVAIERLGREDAESFGGAVSAVGDLLVNNPGSLFALIGHVALESTPQLAVSAVATAVGGPAAGASTIGVMGGSNAGAAEMASFFEARGYDLRNPEHVEAILANDDLMAEAMRDGAIKAGIVGVLDAAGFGIAGKALSNNPFADIALQGFVQGGLGGAGEGLSQYAIHGEVNYSDVLLEVMAEFATAPVEVAAAGRGEVARLVNARRLSGMTQGILNNLDELVAGSRLRERAPDKFVEAVGVAGFGNQDLFVSAKDVQEYFQSESLDSSSIVEWGVSQETYADALATGGNITIPASDYMTRISGSQHADWFKENAVLDPDEMTVSEAQRFNDLAREAIKAAFDEETQAYREAEASKASDVQVYDGFYSQLRSAGQSKDVAEQNATVMQAFFRTMAERYDDDPINLARRFNVKIKGPDDVIAGRRRGDLDIQLNTLRARGGRVPTVGESLIPYLRRMGGLRDYGGDIAAMDPPKGLIAATRQDMGSTQASMLGGGGVQVPGIGIDDAARAAVDAGFFPELRGQMGDLNEGVEGDLVQPLLDAIQSEIGGSLLFREGEGPNPEMAALLEQLEELGLDLSQDNDSIISAMETAYRSAQSDEFFQSDDGDLTLEEILDWVAQNPDLMAKEGQENVGPDATPEGLSLYDVRPGENRFMVKHGDSDIGHIDYIVSDGRVRITQSFVAGDVRGKGLGTRAYEAFIRSHLEQGRVVESDSSVSDAAMRVYQKLEAAGYTVERSPQAREEYRRTTTIPKQATPQETASVTNDSTARQEFEPVATVTAAPEGQMDKARVSDEGVELFQPNYDNPYKKENVINSYKDVIIGTEDEAILVEAYNSKYQKDLESGYLGSSKEIDEDDFIQDLKDWGVGQYLDDGETIYLDTLPEGSSEYHGISGDEAPENMWSGIRIPDYLNKSDFHFNFFENDDESYSAYIEYNSGAFEKYKKSLSSQNLASDLKEIENQILEENGNEEALFEAYKVFLDSKGIKYHIPRSKGSKYIELDVIGEENYSVQWDYIKDQPTNYKGPLNLKIRFAHHSNQSSLHDDHSDINVSTRQTDETQTHTFTDAVKVALAHKKQIDNLQSKTLFQNATAVESEAFKAWFGDSKVVNNAGRPLEVFHGTNEDFESFGVMREGGFFFTDNPDTASDFAAFRELNDPIGGEDKGGRVMPVYLSLQNPLEFDADGQHLVEFEDELIARARDAGHDGVIVRNAGMQMDATYTEDGLEGELSGYARDLTPEELEAVPGGVSNVYIVFEAGDIKSSRANQGTFDPNDPRVLFQDAPATESKAFKDWFQDSHVKGQDGAPKVVYHGTPNDFDAFDISVGSTSGWVDGPGFYFAGDKALAERFKGSDDGRLIEAYLSIQKPLDLGDGPLPKADIIKMLDRIADIEVRDSGGEIETYKDGFLSNYADTYSQDRVSALNEAATLLENEQTAVDQISDLINGAGDKAAVLEGVRDALGFDGIYNSDYDVHIAWFPEQIKSVENQGTFDRSNPNIYLQEKRGSIELPRGGLGQGETVINLFERADLSTFLHESGHFFLEAFSALADSEVAPADMVEDMAAIRKFVGAKAGEAFTVDQHEKWARAFEAYAMEGKAPSLALESAFSRFKAWLTRIYRSIAGLNVKLTPEIKEVMDRMLATDSEIAEARAAMNMRPLFMDGPPPGMSDADFRPYQRKAQADEAQAKGRLLNKTMAKIRREKEQWFKDEKAAVRKQVESEVNSRREYRLIELAANQRWIGNQQPPEKMPDARINRADLVDMFGAGVIAELSQSKFGGKRAIYTTSKDEGGLTPQAAAEFYGFKSAVEMIEALQNTGKRKDAIAIETDRIMTERHGDPLNDGSIEREAIEAIHGDQHAQMVLMESRHLSKLANRPSATATAKVYKAQAQRMIAGMSVRDVMRPETFLHAERKASRDAERAFAKVQKGGSKSEAAINDAATAKERQIINYHLYTEAKKAQDQIRKGRERARAYDKQSVRQKIGSPYIEQIDGLLERFDFRVRSKGQVAQSARLADFVAFMQAEGRGDELAIPEKLLNESFKTHFSAMTVEDMRGLLDTVKNIEDRGRFKDKLRERARVRELNKSADAMADVVRRRFGEGKQANQAGAIGEFFYMNMKVDTIAADIDGQEIGVFYDEFKRSLDEGAALEQKMNAQHARDLNDIFSVYSAKELGAFNKEIHVEGANGYLWSKNKILALAMNMGTQSNLDRVLDPKVDESVRLDESQLGALLDTLDKRDWEFVQAYLDYVNTLWPDLSEVSRRMTGVAPTKVEAKPIETKFGTFRGGYYPVAYDMNLSDQAKADAENAQEAFLAAGRNMTFKVSDGMTKARLEGATGQALDYDLMVGMTHMRDTTRLIAMGEPVHNSRRLLNHKAVSTAFRNAGQSRLHSLLNRHLDDAALGPVYNSDSLNSFARTLKNNFTISKLAFNLKTVGLQPLGVFQSAAVVGKRSMIKAYVEYLRRPSQVSADIVARSDFMAERQTTFQKDMYEQHNELRLNSPISSRARKIKNRTSQTGMWPMVVTQFYTVDVPTWIAAYNNEMANSGDDAKAVHHADRMVDRAQGGGFLTDKTAMELGTVSTKGRQQDWIKIWTTLASYMNTKFNRLYLESRFAREKIQQATGTKDVVAAAANAATNIFLLLVPEAVVLGLLYSLWEDEEEEGIGFWGFVTKEIGLTAIAGVPFINLAAGGLQGYDTGGVIGDALGAPGDITTQIRQGEIDGPLARSIANGVGMVTGLPTTAPMRIIEESLLSDEGSFAEALFGTNPLDR